VRRRWRRRIRVEEGALLLLVLLLLGGGGGTGTGGNVAKNFEACLWERYWRKE